MSLVVLGRFSIMRESYAITHSPKCQKDHRSMRLTGKNLEETLVCMSHCSIDLKKSLLSHQIFREFPVCVSIMLEHIERGRNQLLLICEDIYVDGLLLRKISSSFTNIERLLSQIEPTIRDSDSRACFFEEVQRWAKPLFILACDLRQALEQSRLKHISRIEFDNQLMFEMDE